jgi:hypothetical protein
MIEQGTCAMSDILGSESTELSVERMGAFVLGQTDTRLFNGSG